MARQGGVNLEALGTLITDAIMRVIVPAIDKRIAEASAAAVERSVAPLAGELAGLATLLTQTREQLATLATLELVEKRIATSIEASESFCDQAIERAIGAVQPFKYCGPHDRELAYQTNHCVTHRGSMWIARKDIEPGVIPGTDAGEECWTLAVKCGRDARGA